MKQAISTTGPPRPDVWAAWQQELSSQRDAKLATDLRQREAALYPRFNDYYRRLHALPRRWRRGIGRRLRQSVAVVVAILASMLVDTGVAATYDGVEFPAGTVSFADVVVTYEPNYSGGPVPAARNQEPWRALGIPRQPGGLIDVSLGNGGRITLQFTDNSLVGSGDSTPDLWVFEVGSNFAAVSEPTFVEISKDGLVYYPIGMAAGATSGVDIDAFGFGPKDQFFFVRLTDDASDAAGSGSTGADIDAVGASSSGQAASIILPYLSTGYRFRVVPFGALPGFEQPGFDDSGFSTGNAGFGTPDGFCALNNQVDVKTAWPLNTDILLRKPFALPSNARGVQVSVAIDNDVQVFINGVDVSSGLQRHEGCPTRDSFVFDVPEGILQGGTNLLAVRGRDRGTLSYLDVRITADTSPSHKRTINDNVSFAPVASSFGFAADISSCPSVGYLLEIAGDPNYPVHRLTNNSLNQEIVGFTETIGDTKFNFDAIGRPSFGGVSGLSWRLLSPDRDGGGGLRSDLLSLEFLDRFIPSSYFQFPVDFDIDDSNTVEDYRTILFGNGPAPNSVVTVGFSDGRSLSLTLPENPGTVDGTDGYRFAQGRPGGGFVGTFTFDAILENTSAEPLPGLEVSVAELAEGKVLVTDDGPIGQGQNFSVPKLGEYADGVLGPGELVRVPFVICLDSKMPFSFFVDVHGEVINGS